MVPLCHTFDGSASFSLGCLFPLFLCEVVCCCGGVTFLLAKHFVAGGFESIATLHTRIFIQFSKPITHAFTRTTSQFRNVVDLASYFTSRILTLKSLFFGVEPLLFFVIIIFCAARGFSQSNPRGLSMLMLMFSSPTKSVVLFHGIRAFATSFDFDVPSSLFSNRINSIMHGRAAFLSCSLTAGMVVCVKDKKLLEQQSLFGCFCILIFVFIQTSFASRSFRTRFFAYSVCRLYTFPAVIQTSLSLFFPSLPQFSPLLLPFNHFPGFWLLIAMMTSPFHTSDRSASLAATSPVTTQQ